MRKIPINIHFKNSMTNKNPKLPSYKKGRFFGRDFPSDGGEEASTGIRGASEWTPRLHHFAPQICRIRDLMSGDPSKRPRRRGGMGR